MSGPDIQLVHLVSVVCEGRDEGKRRWGALITSKMSDCGN